MATPRRSFTSTILVGAAVLAAGAGLAIPTAASAATPPADTTTSHELPARLERACLRIPNLETHTDKVIARLNGDASTRGSLKWLQARIDEATAKGRTQLAEVLQNRLKVRTQTLQVLMNRHDRLTKLADLCRNHGVDV
ncbi:MAG TPA: hypothetical protein VGC84_12695 [Ilumatobacteraceae bacterium]